MKTNNTLVAEIRVNQGKGYCRRLRIEGFIPAVIYAKDKETNELVTINKIETAKLYRTGHFCSELLTLEIGKKKVVVLPTDVQFHPVTDVIEHIDFIEVNKDQEIKVNVGVKYINKELSPGLKRGGILNIVRRSVQLICKPEEIPQRIIVDLNGKIIGESIHLRHIELPESATPVIKRDFTLAVIAGKGGTKEDGDEDENSSEAAAA
jgi:large subunit ribosomal protein L25